jgi:hypothetical protein
MVRIRFASGAMKRFAALAFALGALFPAVVGAAPLQRLTVTSFTLTSDTAKPELEVPFHLIVSLHVREMVPEIDNLILPVMVDVEPQGDSRMTQAGPSGTDYRETITVVAHHTGKISLAPATLQVIDARDGKAKQYSTNSLTLVVVGATIPTAPDEVTPVLWNIGRQLLGWFLIWAIGIGAIVLIVVLLARRRPQSAPAPVGAPPPPAPRPPMPMRTRRERLQDALTVLRAERNRPTAVRVRTVVWELIGASEGETLADVLRRPEAADPRMAVVLRALERAAFTYDDDVAPAIEAACEALERYLA